MKPDDHKKPMPTVTNDDIAICSNKEPSFKMNHGMTTKPIAAEIGEVAPTAVEMASCEPQVQQNLIAAKDNCERNKA
jgi:hypothetical protein